MIDDLVARLRNAAEDAERETSKAIRDYPEALREAAATIEALRAKPAPKVTEHVLWWNPSSSGLMQGLHDTHKITIRHTGDTLPFGTYTGPDGATITVEKAE